MKASEILKSREFAEGVKWQTETIEHLIDMNVSSGDYSDFYWLIDKPIALEVLAALYSDGWQAETKDKPGSSVTLIVHVSGSVLA